MAEENVTNIELVEIFKAIKRRILLVILITVPLLAISIYYGSISTITYYEARAGYFIGTASDDAANNNAQFQIDDVALIQEFMNTYCAIAKTTAVSEKTIKKLDLNMSPDELKKHITVTAQSKTPFMDLQVSWANQQQIMSILDAITEVYMQEVKSIYPSSSVKVIEKSKSPQEAKVGTEQLYVVKASLMFGSAVVDEPSQNRVSNPYNVQLPPGVYSAIANTLAVSEKTVKKTNLKISPETLRSCITVTSQLDSPFMSISLKWTNPRETLMILNVLAGIYSQEVKNIYPLIDLRVIEMDKYPRTVVASNKKLYAAGALVVGLIISFLIIFALEFMKDTIKTERDVAMDLELPIIGIVPKEKKKIRFTGAESFGKLSNIIKEAYKGLRTNIYFTPGLENVRTMVISSGSPREGRTTAAVMLAIALAQDGRKTVLIDCDFRKPDIHNMFVLEPRGLSNILAGEARWADVVYKSRMENLFVLPAGYATSNPGGLLCSVGMKKLINELKGNFEYIILDSPPIGLVADAQLLSDYCDGYIIVVDSDVTKKEEAVKSRNLIQYSGGKIIGVLINKIKSPTFYKHYKPYFKDIDIKVRKKRMKVSD